MKGERREIFWRNLIRRRDYIDRLNKQRIVDARGTIRTRKAGVRKKKSRAYRD